jgi:hypothetical protein
VSEDCSSVHGKGLILSVEEEAVAGRIFSLHWLSSDCLLSCGPNGILEMWKLGESAQANWLSQCTGYDSNFSFRACLIKVSQFSSVCSHCQDTTSTHLIFVA